jgi:Flp pilus assembly pilin Flp
MRPVRSRQLKHASLGEDSLDHIPDPGVCRCVPMSFVSLKSDRGAGLVEYALVVMLISIVGLTAVGFVGEETSESFEAVGSSFSARR